jgi:hypothetical protein
MFPPLITHTTVDAALGATFPDISPARLAAPDGCAASLHR